MSDPTPAAPARSDFRFFHPLRVRWGEVDAQGVVFNPNYLVFADVAATEYMRAAAIGPAEMDDLFVVNAHVDFLASALFDDELDIGVGVGRVGRSSFELRFGLFRGPDLLTRVSLTYVRADPVEKRSRALDPALTAKLERFEGR